MEIIAVVARLVGDQKRSLVKKRRSLNPDRADEEQNPTIAQALTNYRNAELARLAAS